MIEDCGLPLAVSFVNIEKIFLRSPCLWVAESDMPAQISPRCEAGFRDSLLCLGPAFLPVIMPVGRQGIIAGLAA